AVAVRADEDDLGHGAVRDQVVRALGGVPGAEPVTVRARPAVEEAHGRVAAVGPFRAGGGGGDGNAHPATPAERRRGRQDALRRARGNGERRGEHEPEPAHAAASERAGSSCLTYVPMPPGLCARTSASVTRGRPSVLG